jgi:hypothetical protein
MIFMNTSLKQRLEFIDLCLHFYGRVSRAMLTKYFQVGTATASRTLKSYAERWPKNAELIAGKAGGYVITPDYTTVFDHDVEGALNLLLSGTVINKLPIKTYGPDTVTLSSQLCANTVGEITRALVGNHSIKIDYLSGNSGRSHRIVHPRHLFLGGGAWYYRAFDERHSEYRTFRFSRTASASKFISEVKPDIDNEWNQKIVLSLAPHNKHPNPEAHAMDIGMHETPVVNIQASEVVAGFLMTDKRVDCSQYGDLNPFEYPLRLMNRSEISDVASMAIAPGFRKINT